MVLSKVTPFSRTVCLALVYFDRKILTYTPEFCNRESGLQPTPCEPKQIPNLEKMIAAIK
jgi:hypothetical protein